MQNEINFNYIEPLGSLKPINSIIVFEFNNKKLLIVGYGNEIRIYSEHLTFYNKIDYHESHNVYGIDSDIKNNVIIAYGVGKIVWYKICFKKIELIKIHEVNNYDLFLASFNINEKWIVVSSKGNIKIFELIDNKSLLFINDLKISKCETLYCIKLFMNFNLQEIMIVGGSAFSKINIWILDLKTNLITKKKILEGHNGVIYDIKVSKDGNEIISCSDDRKIIIWKKNKNEDIENFLPIHILSGHEAIIWSIECFWNKKLLASLSEDGNLLIWNFNQEKKDLLFTNPIKKILRAHEGRGGRILCSLNCEENKWTFLSGGEGGDLKIWTWIIKNNNEINLEFNVSVVETIVPSENTDFEQISIDDWYQGVRLLDYNKLLGVTRKGFFCIGTKYIKNNKYLWKIEKIHQFQDLIYSISITNNGYFVLGSSKGKTIHGQIDIDKKILLWKNEIKHLNWCENVTFTSIIPCINNELYLVLTSCSKGIVGALILKKNNLNNFYNWDLEIIEITGKTKYGEIKCLDFISDKKNFGRIICGTVNGNIFQLIYEIKLNFKVEVEIKLTNYIIGSHKGNVSSLTWLKNEQKLEFQSTGQDGKINQYLVDEKLELKCFYKWRNQCEYIVRCFKLDNNWLVIGALKHELLFFLIKDHIFSTPILIFKQKFGGVKRSFYINMSLLENENIIEIVYCHKPSIKIFQLKIDNLLNNMLFPCNNFSEISISNSLNINPPSRLNYCCDWLNNFIFVIGGEDQTIRFYKILSNKDIELIHSIRLLNPIKKIKLICIKNSIWLLIVSGGKQMLHIFEVTFVHETKIQTNLLFSNDVEKKETNSRFISLDLFLFKKIDQNNEDFNNQLFIFIGSSKAELLIFNFHLMLVNNRISIFKKETILINLSFVPFSLLIKNDFEKRLFIGLSNGIIKIMKISLIESSFKIYNLELEHEYDISCHSSGVNSMVLLNNNFEFLNKSFIISSGHDQKISLISLENNNILSSVVNAHFSSIRDLCVNLDKKILFSISWDQRLNIYFINIKNSSICKLEEFPISVWDPSKFYKINMI